MAHIGLALTYNDDNDGIPDMYVDPVTGSLALVYDSEAVGQHAKQRIKCFRGECPLDTEAGTPWLSEIMGKRYDPALSEAIVKTEIINTHGVSSITSFSVSFDRRKRELKTFNIRGLTEYDESFTIS